MANTVLMEQHFERDKNLKASGITAVVCACIFLIFFFVRWTTPVPPKPEPVIEGIEVNISEPADNGGGSAKPQGQQGSNSNQDNTPQQPSSSEQTSPDNGDAEKNPDGGLPPSSKVPVKKVTPVPPTPTAKATMPKGDPKATGTKPGPGTSDKDPREGTGTGPVSGPGTGSGKPGIGIGGNGNVQIKGDRKMMYYPSRAADVEPGVVTVIVSVTPAGVGTFIDFKTGKFLAAYKAEIISYLKGVTFNKADHESTIEMTFNFKR